MQTPPSSQRRRLRQPTADSLRSGELRSQPYRVLLQIAEQGGIGNAAACDVVMGLICASRHVRRAVEKEMQIPELSESRLMVLIALYAIDPLPLNAADLAFHAGVSRASITRVIDFLVARGWIARHSNPNDRRSTPVGLTDKGREMAVRGAHLFLGSANHIGASIGLRDRPAFLRGCAGLSLKAQALVNL